MTTIEGGKASQIGCKGEDKRINSLRKEQGGAQQENKQRRRDQWTEVSELVEAPIVIKLNVSMSPPSLSLSLSYHILIHLLVLSPFLAYLYIQPLKPACSFSLLHLFCFLSSLLFLFFSRWWEANISVKRETAATKDSLFEMLMCSSTFQQPSSGQVSHSSAILPRITPQSIITPLTFKTGNL